MTPFGAIISRNPSHCDLGLPLKRFEILSRNAMTWVAPSEKDNNTTLEELKKSTLHQAFAGEL